MHIIAICYNSIAKIYEHIHRPDEKISDNQKQPLEVFYKKSFLKHFAKFRRKQL